jgi:mannan endo-1,4-beta-mannosidase
MKSELRTGPTRRWHACLGVIALFALAVAGPASASSKRPPPNPIYWGAQIGGQFTGEQAPWDMGAVAGFELLTGKPPSLISFSSPFAECTGDACILSSFPTTPLENVRQHGSIPFFSWNSAGGDSAVQPAFRLARIIDGTYDAHIRAFAEKSDEWGYPYFLRFDWEMNGFWFPWSEGVNGNRSGEFVAAWRHVHDIFVASGATNATWVWCPNVDFTRNLVPLKGLYPGDDYVDWTCLDGFNWGKTANSAGWQNFNQVFHSTYKRVLKIAPDKPMVIGEVASDERGGSKADWIHSLLRIVPAKYRKVRGLVWYEEKDQEMHWPIESSPAATNAFAKGIARQVYLPNQFSQLTALGPIHPLPW